jgi:hypothetical protein
VQGRADRDQRFRAFVRAIITSQKFGGIGEPSRFELQYVPEHGKSTELGLVCHAAEKTKKKRPARIYTAVAVAAGLTMTTLGLLQAVEHFKFIPQHVMSLLALKG